jgi:hypothetical protein
VNDEQMPESYAARVGERLRAVRKQKRLSLQAVEAQSRQEFKASVLGAYERGERSISVPRLQRLAAFYAVPVDQLLPRDLGGITAVPGATVSGTVSGPGPGSGAGAEVRATTATSEDEGDKVTIDLTRLDGVTAPERDLLRRYLGMIQVQRQDFNGRMLTIRADDVRAIACLFDLSADGMRRRLDDLGLRLNA